MTDQRKPAINIGIMTHNYGRFIRDAIESVIAQSHTDWELVISDDCSTDGTAEIVAPYLEDPRIHYVYHETNLGQAANWAYLLNRGSAPLVAVLHADDAWLPQTLERVVAEFEANSDLDLVYGNWLCKAEGRTELMPAKKEKPHLFSGHDEYHYQAKYCSCLPSAAFLSRRCTILTGVPNHTLKVVVDAEYFLRFCVNARSVKAIAEPLTIYRVHECNMTAESLRTSALIDEQERLLELCAAHLNSSPAHNRTLDDLRQKFAYRTFAAGVEKVTRGDIPGGRRLMKRGIRSCPRLVANPKILIDYLMASIGSPCLRLFLLLHRKRVRAKLHPG